MTPTGIRKHPSLLVALLLSISLTFTACNNQQNQPKQSQVQQDNGPTATHADSESTLSIPYERHVLDNGLTVIIHQDHSDPVAHVDVTYHVGSAREELGKSGFAHLFEHMMFQGSENVADEEHIKTVTEAGGTMNGTTNRDRTNYFETVPVNHLETMLWLEADRMGFFLEAITQEKFEVQRATVKNEKQQNYDNRAYGRAFELIGKTLYPYGHPYSWQTIGDLADLDRATAEDLRNFFLYWYGPNNATITVGGDVDPKQVLALINKYFGGIARGPELSPLKVPSFTLDADRYVSYYDDKIRFPAVTMSFPTVPKFHPDAPALQCLSEILGAGKGSYLYQNLVAPRKAIQASASHRPDELAGEFFMFVMPFPGKSLAEFETELRKTLDDFEQNGVSDSDLEKFKARYESQFISGLEKVSGKVSQLAYYQTFAGSPDRFSQELEDHLAVTKEDVMRVYHRYIKNKPGVILSVLADPNGKPAKPDNYTAPTSGKNIYPTTDYSGLSYKKAKDNFDRSIKPTPQAPKLVSPPAYWSSTSNNGIKLLGTETNELPKVVFRLSLPGGSSLDSLNTNKLGLANLTTAMLNTSTLERSEKDVAEALERLGSTISFSSSAQRFTINVSSLSKNIDATIAILEEKLFKPAFLQEDFKRLQNQALESAKSATKQVSSIASMAYSRLIFGDTHPFGTPITYQIPTLPNITVEDTKTFFEKHFSPEGAELVVVGDISQKQVMQKLGFIFNWKKPASQAVNLPKSPQYSGTPLFFIDKPGAAQSEIRIGYRTDLPYSPVGEYFKRSLMNFTLGGAFNSRINLNLREEKGLTYGARTQFWSTEIAGEFQASTSVKAAGTDIAVSEIMREIELMRSSEISSDELNLMKMAVSQRDALKYESSYQKLGFLGKILRYDIDPGFVETQKQILNKMDAATLHRLAKTHLPVDNMLILVVGDKASVMPKLKALNYSITELSEDGSAITQAAK